MTLSQEYGPEKRFVSAVLPWVVAAAALAVYLLTLNRWVSMASLGNVANISGWNWQPDIDAPLFWLITLPFRWLSPKHIPLALNLISAVCGALTLRLLARSVALLPHDRTEEQRLREKSPFALLSIGTAWVPPVIAALVCGLQLTFWQNATVSSREIFDLLLFAYVIRCLSEFRVTGRDSWLLRASLVYGAAMAENWAMIGFFPLFLIALVWLKGVSFFDGRFLGRMFVLGSIGLLAYLILPLVDSFSSTVPVTFWQALKYNLASQKRFVMGLPFNKSVLLHGFTGDQPIWVLALPSLLPVLALSIRWPSYFGDPSKLGVTLATVIFHILHAVLLVLCVWVALGPEKFSPQHLLGLPSLTLYYLGALSVGYYIGYFLLVFGGTKPQTRPARPVPAYQPFVNFVVSALVWAIVLAAPAVLLYRNLPQVRVANGPMWRQFADRLVYNLPPQGAVVMSDNLSHLFLAEAALAQRASLKQYMFLDTASLRERLFYHKYLAERYKGRWPTNPPPLINDGPDAGKVDDRYLVGLAVKMAETNSTYYLHPSFGYYFELFYPEAHGLVYRLRQYAVNSFIAPACTTEQRGENEEFWNTIEDTALKPLLNVIHAASPDAKRTWMDNLLNRLHLVNELDPEANYLAWLYSRALDHWGVVMQRGGFLTQAASHFNRALDLNPENVVAQVNLDCNRNLQSGTKTVVELSKSAEERLGKFRTLQDVMNANGPFDEPTFCFQQGRAFLQGGNFRQAGQELMRVKQLAPDNIACRLLLSRIYLFSQMPDEALAVAQEIHVQGSGLDHTNAAELLPLETAAHLAKNDVPAADATVHKALEQYPQDDQMLASATRVFINFGCYSNALPLLAQELKLNPDDEGALINQGVAFLRLNRFAEAVGPLTKVIELGSTNFSGLQLSALLNRAIAYLQLGQLDKSQDDYEALQRRFPNNYRFDYGLGEIAYRKKDTVAAIRCYENYMKNAPINAPEITNETSLVMARLKELKGAAVPPQPTGKSNSIPPTANAGK